LKITHFYFILELVFHNSYIEKQDCKIEHSIETVSRKAENQIMQVMLWPLLPWWVLISFNYTAWLHPLFSYVVIFAMVKNKWKW